ncbi:MAG TPA: hypothetical protein VJ732_20005 [Bryobacteraceae bacterium]|nr:hypothetical protein [Bryobacteraceae bacterium]
MQVVWIFAAIIGFTVIAVSASLWRQNRRARQMARAAAHCGLIYEPGGTSLLNQGLAEIPLFALAALGRQGRIRNVVSGEVRGVRAYACDYDYFTGNVNTTRFDYRQTAACFQLRKSLPAFTLHPRTGPLAGASGALNRGAVELLAGMAAPMMGARARAVHTLLDDAEDPGIDLPGCPKFSESYRLLGSDAASLRSLLSPAFVNQLLAQARPVSLESAGSWVVLYRKKELVSPEDVPRFLSESGDLIQLLGQ